MLINVLHRLLCLAVRHRAHARLILLVAAGTMLLFTRPAEYSLMSKESLYKQLDSSCCLLSDADKGFEESPPHQTIFILVDGSMELCDAIERTTRRIKLRSRLLRVSTVNSSEQHFVKLYIREGKEVLNIHPMRNYQPNSDVLELARLVFEPRLSFELGDLFIWRFENRIDISLPNNPKSLRRLAKLLRYYMNIESHVYGLYYYIPTRTGIIRAEHPYMFISLTLLSLLFDFRPGCSPVMVLLAGILCQACPLACVLFLKKEYAFIYGLVFGVINLKCGLTYTLAMYAVMIVDQVRNLQRK